MNMTKINLLRIGIGATVATGLILTAATAQAAECPANKMKPGVRTSGEMTPKDVTDDELNTIDLGSQIAGLDHRRLRFRKLVVQPGGVVPWHDHTDRPALIMTVSGDITEFRSNCSVGVVHTAGDVTKEVAGVMHWWKNEGKEPAVLYAADIKHDE